MEKYVFVTILLELLRIQLALSQQVGNNLSTYQAAIDAQRQFDAHILNNHFDKLLT